MNSTTILFYKTSFQGLWSSFFLSTKQPIYNVPGSVKDSKTKLISSSCIQSILNYLCIYLYIFTIYTCIWFWWQLKDDFHHISSFVANYLKGTLSPFNPSCIWWNAKHDPQKFVYMATPATFLTWRIENFEKK